MNARRLLLLLVVLTSCTESLKLSPVINGPDAPQLPGRPFSYGNLNSDVVTLGRVLFYDKKVSATNDVSCASCHKQMYSFSDNIAFSKGTLNQLTTRNSPALQNSANLMFWDGRGGVIQSMITMPITNPHEMGVKKIADLVKELNAVPYYAPLVRNAYGSSQLSESFISSAIASFIKSVQPFNSKFDNHLKYVGGMSAGVEQKTSPYLNAEELQGFKLYLVKYNCNVCHRVEDALQSDPLPGVGPLPAGPYASPAARFANVGLDAVAVADRGRALITGLPGDEGKFKIPSLRNIALTAPYMHDGRLATLSEVIDHYSKNIKNAGNLPAELRDPNNMSQARKFDISNDERAALIAFLNTLTDDSVVKDVKWGDPFQR